MGHSGLYCVHENENLSYEPLQYLSESCSLGLLCFHVWPPVVGCTIHDRTIRPAAALADLPSMWKPTIRQTKSLRSSATTRCLWCSTPDGVFNSALNSAWNASGINSALFGFFPDLQDDSFATIGLDGPAAMVPGAEDPSLVKDASPPPLSGYFQAGGTSERQHPHGASSMCSTLRPTPSPTDVGWWLKCTGDLSGTLNADFRLGCGCGPSTVLTSPVAK